LRTPPALGDLLDDGAQLGVPILMRLAELGGTQVDLGEKALEGAFERFRLVYLKSACSVFSSSAF
jgi:hypothetical protein